MRTVKDPRDRKDDSNSHPSGDNLSTLLAGLEDMHTVPAGKTPREESKVDREELLKKLADQKLAYYQSIGLAPFKSGQLVSESLESWKQLPTEKLEELLDIPAY